jgi:hypothetical protein
MFNTEEKIEREVERRFDRLDAALARGDVDTAEYDVLSDAIDDWAGQKYFEIGAL